MLASRNPSMLCTSALRFLQTRSVFLLETRAAGKHIMNQLLSHRTVILLSTCGRVAANHTPWRHWRTFGESKSSLAGLASCMMIQETLGVLHTTSLPSQEHCANAVKPQRHLNAKSPLASVGFRLPNTFMNLQVDKTPGNSDKDKKRGKNR